jgi:hypothetical protein
VTLANHNHFEKPRTLRVYLPALTAQQAEVVFNFVCALQDAFFSAYEGPLVQLELAEGLQPLDSDSDHPNEHEDAIEDAIPF